MTSPVATRRVVEASPRDAATDAALLARVAARDAQAMAEIYDRYAPRLYGLIVSLIRDRTSAADVLQEVMVSLWQSAAARYDAALGSAESWMLMLARARAVDHLRRLRRGGGGMGGAPAWAGPDDAVAGLPMRDGAELARGLGRLPRDEQEPIMLAYAHGMSREEIARQLDMPVGTVKTRIRRGLDRLRDMLVESAE